MSDRTYERGLCLDNKTITKFSWPTGIRGALGYCHSCRDVVGDNNHVWSPPTMLIDILLTATLFELDHARI